MPAGQHKYLIESFAEDKFVLYFSTQPDNLIVF